MVSRRFSRIVLRVLLVSLPVVIAVAIAPGAGARPASGGVSSARQPWWAVSYQYKGGGIQSLSATGPKDAWAIGYRVNAPYVLLHWNGSVWRVRSFPHERGETLTSITALSARDVWIFAQDVQEPTAPEEALHWNGIQWSVLALPVDAGAPLVLSDSDIWVTGGEQLPGCVSRGPDSQGCTVTSHWNGSTWRRHRVAAVEITDIVGSSPSNVWATGDSFERQSGDTGTVLPEVFRWMGTFWKRVALRAPRRGGAPLAVAYSPRDVWVGESSVAFPKARAMHWNGRNWEPFWIAGIPPGGGYIASDDHGGLWFSANLAAYAHWIGGPRVIYPRQFIPRGSEGTTMVGLAPVPGSSGAWIYGLYSSPSTSRIAVIAALRG
jgi:hypothetical protein